MPYMKCKVGVLMSRIMFVALYVTYRLAKIYTNSLLLLFLLFAFTTALPYGRDRAIVRCHHHRVEEVSLCCPLRLCEVLVYCACIRIL